MKNADLYFMVKTTRIFLVMVGVFCLFMGNKYPFLDISMLVLFGLVFWLRSTYVYINESFTRYYDGVFFILISFFSSLFFWGALYMASSVLGMSLPYSITLGLSLPMLMVGYYFYAKYKISAPLDYKVKDGRIYAAHIHTSQRLSPIAVGAAAALSSVLFAFAKDSSLHAIFWLLFFAVSTLAVMFYASGTIADLQQIKSEERHLGIRYAFGNLDEIRAWRNHAWAPRLFRYAYMQVQSALDRLKIFIK